MLVAEPRRGADRIAVRVDRVLVTCGLGRCGQGDTLSEIVRNFPTIVGFSQSPLPIVGVRVYRAMLTNLPQALVTALTTAVLTHSRAHRPGVITSAAHRVSRLPGRWPLSACSRH